MNRRRMLALCGLCASGSAGCLSRASLQSRGGTDQSTDGGTDESTDGTPDGTDSTPVSGVVVDDAVVRKAVRYESMMGSGGVLAVEGRQYVVASVRPPDGLSQSDFTFRTDSDSWNPGLSDTVGAINRAVAGHEGSPVGKNFGGSDRSYLAFEVPSPLSASNPRIRYDPDDSEWPLPTRMADRLEAPSPRFELVSLEVPESVSQGETLSVSLTARNVSETDGRFLAALYWPTNAIADDDESRVVEREVAAGEETTASVDIDTSYTAYEDGPVRLTIRGHVAARRDVEVRNASTPS
ncbi:hypothetical protein [Halopelagius longus]|uniref:CARDB protein n=1 Tax=Halopelagius longus TaxID=1236180 RepID=A0A1H1DEY8_9EURY|nr:hypothetical protein [Halopelagius longus]RDI71302.1 hypothetical protein DWB78_05900 [Halopelagius longus]SDQ74974.1 hypothetical protein SAMN05216278_2378 [Halopelagius longus]